MFLQVSVYDLNFDIAGETSSATSTPINVASRSNSVSEPEMGARSGSLPTVAAASTAAAAAAASSSHGSPASSTGSGSTTGAVNKTLNTEGLSDGWTMQVAPNGRVSIQ